MGCVNIIWVVLLRLVYMFDTFTIIIIMYVAMYNIIE